MHSCTIRAHVCGLCVRHKQASKIKSRHLGWHLLLFHYSPIRTIRGLVGTSARMKNQLSPWACTHSVPQLLTWNTSLPFSKCLSQSITSSELLCGAGQDAFSMLPGRQLQTWTCLTLPSFSWHTCDFMPPPQTFWYATLSWVSCSH